MNLGVFHNISSLATWSWFCSFAPPPSRWKICLSTRRVPRWFGSQPLGMFTYMNGCFLIANLGKYTSSSHGFLSKNRPQLIGIFARPCAHRQISLASHADWDCKSPFFVHWSVPSETQHIYVFNGGNHTSVNANWNCIPRWTCWCSRSNPPSCLSDLATFDCWYLWNNWRRQYATHP